MLLIFASIENFFASHLLLPLSLCLRCSDVVYLSIYLIHCRQWASWFVLLLSPLPLFLVHFVSIQLKTLVLRIIAWYFAIERKRGRDSPTFRWSELFFFYRFCVFCFHRQKRCWCWFNFLCYAGFFLRSQLDAIFVLHHNVENWLKQNQLLICFIAWLQIFWSSWNTPRLPCVCISICVFFFSCAN